MTPQRAVLVILALLVGAVAIALVVGPRRGRSVLRAVPGIVATLSVEGVTVDIDTPDDYRRVLMTEER